MRKIHKPQVINPNLEFNFEQQIHYGKNKTSRYFLPTNEPYSLKHLT